jgi:hypothetical protein
MENFRLNDSYLLRRTYELYGSLWKRHVLIAFPATIFSFLIYFLGGQLVTAVSRPLTRWDASHLTPRFFEITAATLAIRFLYFGLTWIFTMCAFAAVCSAIVEKTSPEMQNIGDAYSGVRERLSGIVSVGMISYLPAAFGFWVIVGGSAPIAFKLGSWRHFELTYWMLVSAGSVALFSFLCRFGLSIPYLMVRRPPIPVREAMRVSLSMTKGHESYFAVLVLKLVVASFGGYWLGRYLLPKLWLTYEFTYATSQWLMVIWGIILAVISEPFLFIGLTVLYQECVRTMQSAETEAVATAATAPAPIGPR